MRGLGIATAVMALVVGGCAPRGPAPEPAIMEADGLVTSLTVEVGQDGAVDLALHVTNTGDVPVELEFTSGQRFDFAVSRVDGEDLWRWSAARSFIQALGSETLEAGQTVRYAAEWRAGGATGEFMATGWVTATNRRIEQSARFELGTD